MGDQTWAFHFSWFSAKSRKSKQCFETRREETPYNNDQNVERFYIFLKTTRFELGIRFSSLIDPQKAFHTSSFFYHRRMVLVWPQRCNSFWMRFQRTAAILVRTGRNTNRRRTTCHVKVFDFCFSCFISNPFVIDNQMVSNGELIVWISTQKSVMDFGFLNCKFITNLEE